MSTTKDINRVERACAQLRRDRQTVTFTAVAAHTGLGRTTLYRNPSLRTIIEHHRRQPSDTGSLTAITDGLSTLRDAIEAIAARVRRHEEQLRRIETQQPA